MATALRATIYIVARGAHDTIYNIKIQEHEAIQHADARPLPPPRPVLIRRAPNISSTHRSAYTRIYYYYCRATNYNTSSDYNILIERRTNIL